jgi:hypothetical protein
MLAGLPNYQSEVAQSKHGGYDVICSRNSRLHNSSSKLTTWLGQRKYTCKYLAYLMLAVANSIVAFGIGIDLARAESGERPPRRSSELAVVRNSRTLITISSQLSGISHRWITGPIGGSTGTFPPDQLHMNPGRKPRPRRPSPYSL